MSQKNDKNQNTSNNKYKFNISSSDEDDENENNNMNQIGSRKSAGIGQNNDFAKNFIRQQSLFANKFLKFQEKENNGLYESSMFESLSPKKRVNKFKNDIINDGIEEVDEEGQIEPENLRRNSQEISKESATYTRLKTSILKKLKAEELNFNYLQNDDIQSKKFKSSNQINNNSIESITSKESLYYKSDYENTLRLGTVIESEYNKETTNGNRLTEPNNNNYSKYKSKGLRREKTIRRVETKKSSSDLASEKKENNKVSISISYAENQNTMSKEKLKKCMTKLKDMNKKAYGLNQLLFCSRVVIENALDVSQTISSCYTWVEENYLESQIKKLIKEAKLKEKQKEDKEKYAHIGNLKKVVHAKKNIIKATDYSFKLLLNMIMGIQIAVQSIPNFHIKVNEDLSKYMTNMLYSVQTINFGRRKEEEVVILKEFA
jgi:hypothetical protein